MLIYFWLLFMLLFFYFLGGYLNCPYFPSISVEICGYYYIQVVSVHLVCSLVYIFVIILMLLQLLLLLLLLLLLTIDFSTSSYLCISKQMLYPARHSLLFAYFCHLSTDKRQRRLQTNGKCKQLRWGKNKGETFYFNCTFFFSMPVLYLKNIYYLYYYSPQPTLKLCVWSFLLFQVVYWWRVKFMSLLAIQIQTIMLFSAMWFR